MNLDRFCETCGDKIPFVESEARYKTTKYCPRLKCKNQGNKKVSINKMSRQKVEPDMQVGIIKATGVFAVHVSKEIT